MSSILLKPGFAAARLARPTTLLRPLLASHFSTTPSAQREIQSVIVVGAGLMGAGIAQVAAQAQLNVTMVDLSPDQLQKGRDIIAASVRRVAKKKFPDDEGKQSEYVDRTWSFIETGTKAEAVVAGADLVVEAIVENIDTKQKLFMSLDAAAPKHTIFTSNTSSLPIAEIAKVTSEDRQARFAGLHFFNPVPAMKLVEIVKTDKVDTETYQSLVDVTNRIGKTSVACKDTPGFIVNRLLVPYMMESLRIVERGEASLEDIDVAMKLGAGFPMGPIELSDFVGLDTLKSIVEGWAREGKVEPAFVKPVKQLTDLVAKGHFGRKTGKGFYEYVGPNGARVGAAKK
ncbi:3-hydroxyacyl-CoA dehydrogenase [Jimgerdemannia flammicorona]|uniref:3-hydroxyacyl-CoA dehydrogenase n=1 Tax=Jimgerdemannia flammicorona TaxID=994334 RepID=A0A433DGK1_9FUNG|nr:3-hydroxyacyl-CoA dehydrogenase [Jimgerdemannia flammicorona]